MDKEAIKTELLKHSMEVCIHRRQEDCDEYCSTQVITVDEAVDVVFEVATEMSLSAIKYAFRPILGGTSPTDRLRELEPKRHMPDER